MRWVSDKFGRRGRQFATGCGVAVFGLLAAACGADDDSSSEEDLSGAPSEEASSAEETSASEDFPVTIEHGLGEITLEEPPERVVTLGAADAQIASALGADIVGATENPASPDGNWPGMATDLEPDVAVLDSTTPNIEQIASFEPDLILAMAAPPEYVESYDELSEIAPVLPYLEAPLEDPGDELLRAISQVLGAEDEADELIAQEVDLVEQFVEDHPEAEGMTYAFGQYTGGSLYLALVSDSSSAQFFSRLGLTVPDELEALANDSNTTSGLTQLGEEVFDMLDEADMAFISAYGDGAEEELLDQPLIAESELLASGDLHVIPVDLASALLATNPAVADYTLGELDPLVAESAG